MEKLFPQPAWVQAKGRTSSWNELMWLCRLKAVVNDLSQPSLGHLKTVLVSEWTCWCCWRNQESLNVLLQSYREQRRRDFESTAQKRQENKTAAAALVCTGEFVSATLTLLLAAISVKWKETPSCNKHLCNREAFLNQHEPIYGINSRLLGLCHFL